MNQLYELAHAVLAEHFSLRPLEGGICTMYIGDIGDAGEHDFAYDMLEFYLAPALGNMQYRTVAYHNRIEVFAGDK